MPDEEIKECDSYSKLNAFVIYYYNPNSKFRLGLDKCFMMKEFDSLIGQERENKRIDFQISLRSFLTQFPKILENNYTERSYLLDALTLSRRIESKIYRNIVEVQIYNLLGNHVRSQTILKELINYHPYKVLLSEKQQMVFTSQNEFKQFIKLLANIKITTKDKVLLRIFYASLYNYYIVNEEQKTQEIFTSEFDYEWSLNEIRNYISSPKYGFPMLTFWIEMLIKRVSLTEVVSLYDSNLKLSLVKDKFDDYLPLIKRKLPLDSKIREFVFKKVNGFIKSNKPQNQLKALYLFENPEFFIAYKNKYQTDFSLFSFRRKVFRKQLEKGKQLYYMLYKLIELNDLNENYFKVLTKFE